MTNYLVPGPPELPMFEIHDTVTPSPTNPMGVKGIGEAGTIASPPAVINAVVDALAHLGVRNVARPATPERVWNAIQEAQKMIPAAFEYEVAESVEHAIELLGSKEDPKLLAGGHSLLPFMKFRLARPATLIDLGRVSGLSGVRDEGEHLAIGALTRHHDLEHDALVQEHCPLLAYAAGLVGDSQVRHRGTIGGSLAHGDPAADLPTIALTLDAEIVLRGPGGERTIAASDFFQGFYETALEPNEVLVEVRVPKTGTAGLVVHQVPPAGARLGDGRGGRRGRGGQRNDRGCPDRADEHGPDAAAGGGGRAGARRARRRTASRPRPSRRD